MPLNCNPSLYMLLHLLNVWDEITYPSPNFNDAAVEVWKWIVNFIPRFAGHGITYPCWD